MVILPPPEPELCDPHADRSASMDSKRQLMKRTLESLNGERCKSAGYACDSEGILYPPLDNKGYDNGVYGDDVCTKVPAIVRTSRESLFSTAICCPSLLSALLL